jgi:hypothetical protein
LTGSLGDTITAVAFPSPWGLKRYLKLDLFFDLWIKRWLLVYLSYFL